MQFENGKIVTERLIIKPYAVGDKNELKNLLINEEIKKTFMIPDFNSEKELNAMVEKLFTISNSSDNFERGIYINDILIGFILEVEKSDCSIEIGYAIEPSYQGKGYATESFRAVIEYLFKIGFKEITAAAFSDNLISQKVMIKCGLKKFEKQECIIYHGKENLCVYYRINS